MFKFFGCYLHFLNIYLLLVTSVIYYLSIIYYFLNYFSFCKYYSLFIETAFLNTVTIFAVSF